MSLASANKTSCESFLLTVLLSVMSVFGEDSNHGHLAEREVLQRLLWCPYHERSFWLSVQMDVYCRDSFHSVQCSWRTVEATWFGVALILMANLICCWSRHSRSGASLHSTSSADVGVLFIAPQHRLLWSMMMDQLLILVWQWHVSMLLEGGLVSIWD